MALIVFTVILSRQCCVEYSFHKKSLLKCVSSGLNPYLLFSCINCVVRYLTAIAHSVKVRSMPTPKGCNSFGKQCITCHCILFQFQSPIILIHTEQDNDCVIAKSLCQMDNLKGVSQRMLGTGRKFVAHESQFYCHVSLWQCKRIDFIHCMWGGERKRENT